MGMFFSGRSSDTLFGCCMKRRFLSPGTEIPPGQQNDGKMGDGGMSDGGTGGWRQGMEG